MKKVAAICVLIFGLILTSAAAEACRHVDELGYCLGSIVPGSGMITDYTPSDDTYHYEHYQEDWICICGVRHTVYDGWYGEHVYSGNVCIYCGYGEKEGTCRHDETYNEYYSYGEYLNQDSHTIYTDYAVYCQQCGEYLSYVEGSGKVETHNFWEGVCYECGYELDRDCTHPSRDTEILSTPYFDFNEGYGIKENGHIMCVDRNVYCDVCGELVDSMIENEWVEAHTDNGKGKCAVCGYDMPREDCDHAEKRELIDFQTVYADEMNHAAEATYSITCKCGKADRTEKTIQFVPHNYEKETKQWEEYAGRTTDGEILFVVKGSYLCSCGAEKVKMISSETVNAEKTYTSLLQTYARDAHNNPFMDDNVRSVMALRFKEKNLSDDVIDEIFACVDSAEPLYQKLFAYSFYEIPFGDFALSGNSRFDYPEDSEVRMLNLGQDAFGTDDNENCTIFFHELGHGIDFYAAKKGKDDYYTTTTQKRELYEALEKDVGILIQGYLSIQEKYYEGEDADAYRLTEEEKEEVVSLYLSGERLEASTVADRLDLSDEKTEVLQTAMLSIRGQFASISNSNVQITNDSNACMVIDIMDGMTGCSLFGTDGHSGIQDYWFTHNLFGYERTGNQCSEAFAEFFAAKITNNQEKITMNKEYFPYTTLLLEETAEEMLEYYLKKALQ